MEKLSWQKVVLTSPQLIPKERWRQASTVIGDSLIFFGGFTSNPHHLHRCTVHERPLGVQYLDLRVDSALDLRINSCVKIRMHHAL